MSEQRTTILGHSRPALSPPCLQPGLWPPTSDHEGPLARPGNPPPLLHIQAGVHRSHLQSNATKLRTRPDQRNLSTAAMAPRITPAIGSHCVFCCHGTTRPGPRPHSTVAAMTNKSNKPRRGLRHPSTAPCRHTFVPYARSRHSLSTTCHRRPGITRQASLRAMTARNAPPPPSLAHARAL